MNAKVAIVNCPNYDSLTVGPAVKRAVELIGGVNSFIRPGSRVLVKPNLLMAKSPEFGVTTHPEVVRQTIRLLKEIDCFITVADGPSVWGNQIEDVDEVYERTGIKKICEEEGVHLAKLEKRRMRQDFPLAALLDECDHIVNIPKLKTHTFTVLSCAIKNLFGLVSGTFKTELHKKYFEPLDFARILVEVFFQTRPALTIVDGIVAMEGDGPATGGKLRESGLILAGSDCVAIDSVASAIMGLNPEDILTTKEAATRGLGVSDLKYIEIKGQSLEQAMSRPFLLPTNSPLRKKVPRPVIELVKKLVRYYPWPERNNCIRCISCVQACPVKAVSMGKKGIVFDYKKCIACFCCQEACPAAAIKVKKSILVKMLGL